MTAHASEAAVEAGFAGVLRDHHDLGAVVSPEGWAWRCTCGEKVSDLAGWTDAIGAQPEAVKEAHAAHVAAALLASPEFAGMVGAARAEAAGALRDRLTKAVGRLDCLVDTYWEANERARIRGKSEGVRLALSYLDEQDRAASHGEGTA